MADYKQQQLVDTANALAQKRKVDAQKKLTDAAAEEETARYDRALQNNAGAGRGKQGGPTAEQAQKAYAKGGSVSSRADGIAQRGKTKGRMC
jgi:hypothetical protein